VFCFKQAILIGVWAIEILGLLLLGLGVGLKMDKVSFLGCAL
jgi:hypothetical protein